MGLYAFIFGCIAVGILLWLISSLFLEYLPASTSDLISTAGSLLFVIGLGSLATTFVMGYFRR